MKPQNPTPLKSDLESELEQLPEDIKKLKIAWGQAVAEKKMIEGKLYMQYRAENPEMQSTDIKEKVKASIEVFRAHMKEVTTNAEYESAYEILMAKKKIMNARAAY